MRGNGLVLMCTGGSGHSIHRRRRIRLLAHRDNNTNGIRAITTPPARTILSNSNCVAAGIDGHSGEASGRGGRRR